MYLSHKWAMAWPVTIKKEKKMVHTVIIFLVIYYVQATEEIGRYLLLVRTNLHFCSADRCFALLLLLYRLLDIGRLLQLSPLDSCRTGGGQPAGTAALARRPVGGGRVEGDLLELLRLRGGCRLLNLLAHGGVAWLENVFRGLVVGRLGEVETSRRHGHIRPESERLLFFKNMRSQINEKAIGCTQVTMNHNKHKMKKLCLEREKKFIGRLGRYR